MVKPSAAMKQVSYRDIDIDGGFWKEKQLLIRNVTMMNVYRRFAETGRFDAFAFGWKEGDPNKPHVFFDSDVAKWMEAVAYLAAKERCPELEKIVDDTVDLIEKNRMPDGYFNSYFGHIDPEGRFTDRSKHELYCAGHLIEAAIAYRDATGKDRFLRLMTDYADLIYDIFYVKKSAAFTTPGHEEIELALVKLSEATGDPKYTDLADYFIRERGREPGSPHAQDHAPVADQRTAEGHAVRACYLYSGAADLARVRGDSRLREAVTAIFDNIVDRRMYVTGAIGQTCVHEAFMGDYDLPNMTAYAETCANLSLALFARRMTLLEPDAKYADTAELVIYNSFLSGISLDGKSFFYSNMQENDCKVRRREFSGAHREFCPADERVEVFSCSCCPPNVVRFIASIADFMYGVSGDTVWVHQYISSTSEFDGRRIAVRTAYPYDGTVNISYSGVPGKLALRIPGWATGWSLEIGGKPASGELRKGYLYVGVNGGDEIKLRIPMPVRFIEANPEVWDDAGRVAVARGPIVFCLEGKDNGRLLRDIRLDPRGSYSFRTDAELGVPVLRTTGYSRYWNGERLYGAPAPLVSREVTLIPYFAMANRGETDMIIWVLPKY